MSYVSRDHHAIEFHNIDHAEFCFIDVELFCLEIDFGSLGDEQFNFTNEEIASRQKK
jgi:hypothetical protein